MEQPTSGLQSKYNELITAARSSGVQDLQVREQGEVLYIDGTAPSGDVKDNLWSIYNKIDPDFRNGDLILNINVAAMVTGARVKVTTETSNLNIRKGPGTDQTVLAVAPHHSYVTLISKTNEQWWLIRTGEGIEGYAYARYLSVE
jgi:hypothetical protein